MDDLIAKLEAAVATGLIMERDAIALQRALGLEDAHDTDWKQCCWRALKGSLDAALALAERVLPDEIWSFEIGPSGSHVETKNGRFIIEGSAPTPALALTIAILRATREKSNG